MNFDTQLAKDCNLIIVHENMAELSKNNNEEFAKLRRNGLGASDSSIILGVNPYEKDWSKLIEQKCSKELTQDEIRIGLLPQVRKGTDLEPIVLNKFEEWSDMELYKPNPMYRLKDNPQLTVNFDGVSKIGDAYIPIEAKCISSFAHKYWRINKALDTVFGGEKIVYGGADIKEHITTISDLIGIPAYYYTQVQQQLLALNASFGYLAALFDKDWTLRVYKIYADEFTQRMLIQYSKECWDRIVARQ